MPLSLMELLRRYRRDERGVVSVMAVGALVLSLAVAMIVIDAGAMLYARRDLQAATDAAALGAVRQLESAEAAQAAAASIFDMNDYPTTGITTVRGVYAADPSLTPEDRFTEADGTTEPSQINAIRVMKSSQAPTYFARVFGFDALTEISTVSTAAYMKTVSFSAGTRVAELNEGLANQVLGGLLGTTLNLSLIDYNGLADANINALSFLDALATEVGLEAGSDTYGDLLSADVTLGNLVAAAVEVLNSDTYEGDRANALQALVQLPAAGVSVPLDRIVDATPFIDRTIGSIGSGLGDGLDFNLLNLVSGAATAMGEGQAVGFNTALSLPPLASVSGTVTVGSPMAHMAIGKVGDFVRTSQVTVQLNANVLTIPLFGDVVSVPIYISAAEGTATVSSIPCIPSGTRSVLSGVTGTVTARYGTESSTTATINLLVATARISGSVSAGSGGPTQEAFSQSDIDDGVVKTVSSNVSILSDLGSAITLDSVTVLGVLPIIGLNGLVSTLLSTVGSALALLDPVINSLLTTLGVTLGSMDMTVHGVRCNAPVLVL